jgi:alpha-glucosidase
MSARRRSSAFSADMVIYQIYPRSFNDSDDNGIGDLPGIERKLDYLSDLGITAIWLSPIYRSPMVDFGYDVSDYCSVDPMFGTMRDLDHLIAQAHKKGMCIIMDLVVNHTSDQHDWFKASCKSRDNPKRNWYIWKDPAPDGGPPNNWLSAFGGSAWEFDQPTKQYYLHSFAKEQPDLNWQNRDVRRAIKDVMRFWLDKGVDGFRVDAVYWLGKDPLFRDDLKNPHYDPKTQSPYESVLHTHSKRDKRLYSYLRELSKVAKSYHRVLITEAYPHRRFGYRSYLRFYKIDPKVLAPFNFEGIFLPWNAGAFQNYIDGFQQRLQRGHIPVFAMANHDKPRIVSRFGQQEARAIALLLLMLPGIPTIYYGDEIGLDGVTIPKDKERDPFDFGVSGSRDVSRTPMQWTSEKHAGFSRVAPWLPVAKDYRTYNVEHEAADPHSLLNLYKKMLDLRAQSNIIKHGTYKPLHLDHPDLFGFVRTYRRKRLAIIINFSKTTSIPINISGEVLLSTHLEPSQEGLRPLEGRILSM